MTLDQTIFLHTFRAAVKASSDFDHETNRADKDEVISLLRRAHEVAQRDGFVLPREVLVELPEEYLELTAELLLSVMMQILSQKND